MRAGELPHRIPFQKKIETLNANGQVVTTWGPTFKLSGRAEKQGEQTAAFTIRCNESINAGSHRILYWGKYWSINTAIHVHDSRDDRTTLQSDASTLIEVTHLQSTEREYVDGNLVETRPPIE